MSSSSSRHKIGDVIILDFYGCGKLEGGVIKAIKYTDYGKILYDVGLYPFSGEEHDAEHQTILKDIDSYFVQTEYDRLLGIK